MAHRCRYPRLATTACRFYGLVIWLYPPSLRREFHHELRITFRSRAEDVLNTGSVVAVLVFACHITADWARTLTFESDEPPSLSLLGLGAADDRACGCLDRTTCSVSLMLATLGVILLVAGWYGWLSLNAEILSRHRAL